MEPTTYYVDSTIRITSEDIFLRDRVYTLDAVSAVEVKAFRANRSVLRMLRLALLFLAFMVANLILWDSKRTDIEWLMWMDSVSLTCFVVFGVVGLALVLYYIFQLNRTPHGHIYVARLRGTFGQTSVLASVEAPYVELAASKIGEALRKHGGARARPNLTAGYNSGELFPNEDGIAIASDSVRLGNNVYLLADVKSAKYDALQIDPIADRLDLVVTAGCTVYIASRTLQQLVEDHALSISPWLQVAGSFAVLSAIMIPLFKTKDGRPQAHCLQLTGKFGNVVAFASLDEAHVRNIVAAINLARKNRLAAATPSIET